MANKELSKQIIEKGLKALLDESKIPYAVHLETIKQLKILIDTHNKEIKKHQEELSKNEGSRVSHERQISFHNKQIEEFQSELERYKNLARGEQGIQGFHGRDGYSPSIEEIAKVVISLIRIPEDGKPGKNGENGKDAKVNEEKIAKEIIELIKKKKILNIDDITGLRSFVKDGTSYKFEELMHGGGGSSGGSITYSYDLSSQCNSSNKIFTVPANTNFVQLSGTDAPQIYRPTTDYTGTGTTTLTLTSAVNAPSNGATLILLYVV